MDWLFDLLSNKFLITGISAWLIAQVLKLLIHTIVNRKFDFWRLFGDGGMPSGHSATVVSVATMCALNCGLGSVEFAISAILAIVVCHDATGVRLETGKQAVILNEMKDLMNKLTNNSLSDDVKLKEFVGHTNIQVIVGILLGFAVAFAFHYFVFI